MNRAVPSATMADGALPLALAVAARHDALRVYPDPPANRTSEAPWDGRSLPSGPYAVYLHDVEGNAPILALEFDGDGNVGSEAINLAERLRTVGIRFVLCASGRPGHHHVFVTVQPSLRAGTVKSLLDGLHAGAPSLDRSPMRNVRTGAIRPPLAPHRLGGYSQLLHPTDPEEALALLIKPNPAEALQQAVTEIARPSRSHVNLRGGLTILQRPLSEATECLLREGDRSGHYRSRSEAEAALVLGLVDAGWSAERIQAAAEDPSYAGFPKFREKLARSPRDAHRYLQRTLTSALARASSKPPTRGQVKDDLQKLAGVALNWHPGGRTAAVDRAVLLAHVRAAIAAGSRTHGLSVRQGAEWAGVADHRTVARARRRLSQRGWIKPVAQNRNPEEACCFILLHPGGGENSPHSFPRGREGMVSRLLTRDLFRSGALGLGSAEVYARLQGSEHEWTVTALAGDLGHDRKTIRRHLRTLQDLRLAVRTSAGWLATVRSPEDAVHELPLYMQTTAERQRQQHERERQAYRAQLRRVKDGEEHVRR